MSKTSERILTENPNRYVMFPIEDHDIWKQNLHKSLTKTIDVVKTILMKENIKGINEDTILSKHIVFRNLNLLTKNIKDD